MASASISEVHKYDGSAQILEGVNLSIDDAQFVALTGHAHVFDATSRQRLR